MNKEPRRKETLSKGVHYRLFLPVDRKRDDKIVYFDGEREVFS